MKTIGEFKKVLYEEFRTDVIDVIEDYEVSQEYSDKSEPIAYGCFKIRIYTNVNCYTIVAREHKDRIYLGCVVSSRKPRAGEDWTRGNDLPDGDLSLDTWERIKNGIIRYELIKIAKSK